MEHDYTKSIKNYFNLPNPDKLQCYVEHYSSQLSNLTIAIGGYNIEGKDHYFEVAFTGIALLDLPTEWTNANFRLASPDECIEQLRTLPKFDDLEDDYLLWYYKMYSINLARRELRIIASNSNILSKNQIKK